MLIVNVECLDSSSLNSSKGSKRLRLLEEKLRPIYPFVKINYIKFNCVAKALETRALNCSKSLSFNQLKLMLIVLFRNGPLKDKVPQSA